MVQKRCEDVPPEASFLEVAKSEGLTMATKDQTIFETASNKFYKVRDIIYEEFKSNEER